MNSIIPTADSVASLTQNAAGGVLTDSPTARDATPRMARKSVPTSLPDLVVRPYEPVDGKISFG